jgi:hypothetical protein
MKMKEKIKQWFLVKKEKTTDFLEVFYLKTVVFDSLNIFCLI